MTSDYLKVDKNENLSLFEREGYSPKEILDFINDINPIKNKNTSTIQKATDDELDDLFG